MIRGISVNNRSWHGHIYIKKKRVDCVLVTFAFSVSAPQASSSQWNMSFMLCIRPWCQTHEPQIIHTFFFDNMNTSAFLHDSVPLVYYTRHSNKNTQCKKLPCNGLGQVKLQSHDHVSIFKRATFPISTLQLLIDLTQKDFFFPVVESKCFRVNVKARQINMHFRIIQWPC